ncbi:glutamate racemase [Winogradskyella sp.]|uniref:glutamate racemase n=1 Tax=Winogradskyella sp. TaxID=1883156 RepID=UPI0025F40215|nr:glutamate racemase [Winogradskyella sp.]MBT8245105.1 glutamate racemase [Winogradskyella sp.]
MNSTTAPIGIFDSGVGGTSIWKEITQLLPNENTVYLSDSINAPYGEKSKEDIISLAKKNTDFLIQKGCKIIVVACNTATTNAIKVLRATYPLPFIGIEPAIKPASLQSKTNVIGILATKGTLSSELFEKTSSTIKEKTTLVEIVGKGLVELIESGKIDTKEMHNLLETYLNPLLEKNIDCLVLGCTHYPFLIDKIKQITGPKIQIIDSGEAVARQTKAILQKNNILNLNTEKGKHHLLINQPKKVLSNLIESFNSGQHYKIEELHF